MNKQISRILAVTLSIAVIWWVLDHQVRKTSQVSTTSSTPTQVPVTNIAQNSSSSLAGAKQQTQPNLVTKSASNNELREYVEKLRQDPGYEWKLPINFFGSVVDESNGPIANADIHFDWNTISTNGVISGESLEIKSDESGLFELRDKKGDPLSVSVDKQGYYPRKGTFWYNPDRGPFRPDQNNPFIFRLHKKGSGVDLITSQHGMSPNFHIHFPSDEMQVKVDLIQQKTGDTGQMIMSENKPEYKSWQQATQWSFKVEIPDGGFVGENDEYPYEAPADGYQSAMEFDFQKSNPDWTTGITTNFYIVFGNPPTYGRLQIQTDITSRGAILTYAINPSGSKNLEPK